jgi:hypothetical protein
MLFFLWALFSDFSVTATRPFFLVDFDDTIFPTFHLVRLGASVPKRDIVALTAQVRAFVEKLEEVGDVVIVTASSPGWVPAVIARVFPSLSDLFESKRVVYSREKLDDSLASSRDVLVMRDKTLSFVELLGEVNTPESDRVVVSFSDAANDIDSFAEACLGYERLICRSVQFKLEPSLNEITRQLEIVCDMLDFIVTSYPLAKIVSYAIGKVADKMKLLRGPLNRVRHLPSTLPPTLRSVIHDRRAASELQTSP